MNAFNPEQPESQESEQNIIRQIRARLETIGGGKRVVLVPERIEITLERNKIGVMEHIGARYALEETLAFSDQEDESAPYVDYGVTLHGVEEINDEVLKLIDRLERERGVSFTEGKASSSLKTLKRIQKLLES